MCSNKINYMDIFVMLDIGLLVLTSYTGSIYASIASYYPSYIDASMSTFYTCVSIL